MSTPKKHHEPRKCKNPNCGKIFMPASRTHKVCLKCRREQNDYKQKRLKAEQQKKQQKAEQECAELKMKSWAKLLNIDYYRNYGKIRAYCILNQYSELEKRAPYLVPARTTT